MSTDTKTVFKHFGYLRCDDFAAYLEDMAAKGWHLDSWGAGLKFRRGAPEQATYAVEVFSDATEYDTRPEPNTEEFAEYCEAAGWHLVDAKRKFVIFKKLRPDAHPIMTDEERLEAVFAEEKKWALRELAISGLWCVGEWGDFLSYGFLKTIFIHGNLLSLIFWTSLFAAVLGSFLHLMFWNFRTKKRLADGQMLHLGRGGSFQNRAYNAVITVALPLLMASMVLEGHGDMLLIVLFLFGALLMLNWLVAKKRPDAVTNQIITVLTSGALVLLLVIFGGISSLEEKKANKPEDFPLHIQDLGGESMILEESYDEYWVSMFGSVRDCSLFYEDEFMTYTVYESGYDWVLDRIWKIETGAPNWESGNAAEWNAEETVTRFGRDYVVRWADWILVFTGPWEDAPLTAGQIETVLDALRP